MKSYKAALQDNLIDEGMIAINAYINQLGPYVTTSSCTGRAILISKKSLRSKYETTFHFKTHNPKKIPELNNCIPTFEGELWFLIEAPNIHIRCKSIEAARKIHQIGLQAKLSKSKFQSIAPAIVVEILGTGSLQVPLGEDGKFLTDNYHYELILSKGKSLLQTEQKRLDIFKSQLSELKE